MVMAWSPLLLVVFFVQRYSWPLEEAGGVCALLRTTSALDAIGSAAWSERFLRCQQVEALCTVQEFQKAVTKAGRNKHEVLQSLVSGSSTPPFFLAVSSRSLSLAAAD